MKNRLIYRMLGALSSALIIASVFIPFINVTGYSTNLWDQYGGLNSLYLPIMIIIFGAIGVIFFALDIKTEFAYMSTGAIIFFLVMRTLNTLDGGSFASLGVGYYTLAVGAILTGFFAFLLGLKKKTVVSAQNVTNTHGQETVLNQMDQLYNEPARPEVIQPLDNIVIPVQPIQPVLNDQVNIQPVMVEPQINPVPEVQPISVNPVINQAPVMQNPIPEVQPVAPIVEQPINPVVQEFSQPVVNPVTQEFNQPAQPVMPEVQPISVNPVINQAPVMQNPIPEVQPVAPIVEQPINPVVQEFGQSVVNPVIQEFNQPEQPNLNNLGGIINNQTNGTAETDIFGQPINR